MIAPELMGHFAIPYNWKECVFHGGCSFHMKSIFRQDSLRLHEKESGKREDKPSSSHLGEIQMKKNPVTIYQCRGRVHYHSNWKHDQDVACWIKLCRAQDQGLRFLQTKSNTIIVHSHVLADRICNSISQNGDRTWCERLSGFMQRRMFFFLTNIFMISRNRRKRWSYQVCRDAHAWLQKE